MGAASSVTEEAVERAVAAIADATRQLWRTYPTP